MSGGSAGRKTPMQNIVNKVKSTALGVAEQLTPVLKVSCRVRRQEASGSIATLAHPLRTPSSRRQA